MDRQPISLRLGSADFYGPCPVEVLELIASNLLPGVKGSLLDNCAGDGFAADFLAQRLGLSMYLVEPHPKRFKECARIATNAVQSPAEDVTCSGTPGFWFFNPPFDPDDQSEQMELSIFRASLKYAAGPRTLCVWLMPDRALEGDWFYSAIANSQKTSVRKFPPPHDSELGQFVTYMYCKNAIRSIDSQKNARNTKTTIEELPVLKKSEFQYAVKSSEPFHLR